MEIAVFADKIGLVQQMLELQEDSGVNTAYVEGIVAKLASSDSASFDMMEVLMRRVKISGILPLPIWSEAYFRYCIGLVSQFILHEGRTGPLSSTFLQWKTL